MQLSAALLLSFLILCATGAGSPLCRAAGIRPIYAALLAAALLPLRLFPISPTFELTLNPAALLLLGLAAAAAAREGGKSLWLALGAGAGAGLLMLLLPRILPFPAEPALPLAVLGLLAAAPLAALPGCTLFAAALMPLAMELWGAAWELHAFGYTTVTLGSTLALNVQVATVFLVLLLMAGREAIRARRTT